MSDFGGCHGACDMGESRVKVATCRAVAPCHSCHSTRRDGSAHGNFHSTGRLPWRDGSAHGNFAQFSPAPYSATARWRGSLAWLFFPPFLPTVGTSQFSSFLFAQPARTRLPRLREEEAEEEERLDLHLETRERVQTNEE